MDIGKIKGIRFASFLLWDSNAQNLEFMKNMERFVPRAENAAPEKRFIAAFLPF